MEEEEFHGEMTYVGAGLGGIFVHTSELKVMKYKEVVTSGGNKRGWELM